MHFRPATPAVLGPSSQLAILTTVQPLVSVVVPVFNGMPHLSELADAILTQSYAHLDIVFAEGGSTDGSIAFLKTIQDPRVKVISMPPGTSAAANWTAATQAARGEFTKLICQDDLIEPQAIEKQVADLQTHPSAVMAVCLRNIIDAHGRVLFRDRGLSGIRAAPMATIAGSDLIRFCYAQGTNVIGEPLAVLFRTEALKSAMPWQDANPLMLDLSTYQVVAPAGDVVVRREALGAFRVSAQSWSTRLAKEQFAQTRRWQRSFEERHATTKGERMQAAARAAIQVNLRRAVYAALRLRGSLS